MCPVASPRLTVLALPIQIRPGPALLAHTDRYPSCLYCSHRGRSGREMNMDKESWHLTVQETDRTSQDCWGWGSPLWSRWPKDAEKNPLWLHQLSNRVWDCINSLYANQITVIQQESIITGRSNMHQKKNWKFKSFVLVVPCLRNHRPLHYFIYGLRANGILVTAPIPRFGGFGDWGQGQGLSIFWKEGWTC